MEHDDRPAVGGAGDMAVEDEVAHLHRELFDRGTFGDRQGGGHGVIVDRSTDALPIGRFEVQCAGAPDGAPTEALTYFGRNAALKTSPATAMHAHATTSGVFEVSDPVM